MIFRNHSLEQTWGSLFEDKRVCKIIHDSVQQVNNTTSATPNIAQ